MVKQDLTKEYSACLEKSEISLLKEEQVFGDDPMEPIRKAGTRSRVSDFCEILGAGRDEQGYGSWMLSTQSGYGDVCAVKEDGSRKLIYADAMCGIRPVITGCKGNQDSSFETGDREGFEIIIDKDGVTNVAFGEYPQRRVETEEGRTLEREYQKAALRKTGKKYYGLYVEYEYEGGKYIRATEGESEKPVWISVSTLWWLLDETTGTLISRDIVAFGMSMGGGNFYDGDFEKTPLWGFLKGEFRDEIIPSVITEITEEERLKREEDMKRAEERRNPYGLKFDRVTEEDIIRGAIESDVPVFIHGPSSEGKSARVKQIDPTCEIIYLRNATPDSLNGRSVYNQSTGEMIDIPPTWFKKVVRKCEEEPDTFHVVFFDEINNALPSIQGMAFNIVLDREVNGLWKLPGNARVVAAGNDMQDSLAANQIAAPFFNRFAHVYINTTTDKWLKWARENDIHPAIYAYIAYKDGETLRSEYTGEKPNADPRKWEMASKMLYTTGQPEMLRALIGEDITDEFVQFCNQPVITLDRVLAGDYTQRELDELDISQRYATVMGLSQAEEEQLEEVRKFTEKLGEEFVAVMDSMRKKK